MGRAVNRHENFAIARENFVGHHESFVALPERFGIRRENFATAHEIFVIVVENFIIADEIFAADHACYAIRQESFVADRESFAEDGAQATSEPSRAWLILAHSSLTLFRLLDVQWADATLFACDDAAELPSM